MHGQWLRDPVTFMPRRCQRPERKLALHRFLHTPLSKKSNNFSERLLVIIKEFVLWPEFRKWLHVCIRSLSKESTGGGGSGSGGGGIVAYEYKSRFN